MHCFKASKVYCHGAYQAARVLADAGGGQSSPPLAHPAGSRAYRRAPGGLHPAPPPTRKAAQDARVPDGLLGGRRKNIFRKFVTPRNFLRYCL